jgi:asparagine synthase (glutamine-hydrolysing)
MCGIVGIWNVSDVPTSSIEFDRFTDSLAHRGPDGRGVFFDPKFNVALGHRRLAILDVGDSGSQPMSYGEDRYWISYNGEIYNFIELRAELKGLGHRFTSDTDTEVVLASYAQWGEDCQYKFNGMWAFAIWDSVESSIFLSRDRFGVKPLFFMHRNGNFIFASELKAFMSLPDKIRPGFDLEMVARMKNEESLTRTLIEGVNNLNAGCCLKFNSRNTLNVRKWWVTSDHLCEVPPSFEEQVTKYRELFYDACMLRMRSDVSVGTTLSGGLDSSSILCAMSKIRERSTGDKRLAEDWRRAFILVYSDSSHDESKYAEQVIDHTGVPSIYRNIDPKSIPIDDVIKSICSFEAIQNAEPSLGPWLIYQEMARAGVKVAMDGLGGDETLAGYHEHLPIAMKDVIFPWIDNQRWFELRSILRGLYDGEVSEGSNISVPGYLDVMKMFLPRTSEGKDILLSQLSRNPNIQRFIIRMYKGVKLALGNISGRDNEAWLTIDPARLQAEWKDKGQPDWDHLQRYLYNDFHYGTNARGLRNFDRTAMAHGVESRAPFMDWRLVCYAFSLPPSSKLGSGFTKRILREAMRDVLPDSIRSRKGKLGFASPMPVWYKYFLRNYVLDTLGSSEFLQSPIWNGILIKKYTENCFKQEDYVGATRSWKFIQAMVLMNQFKTLSQSS